MKKQYDFEPANRFIKKPLDKLEEQITKVYGEPCRTKASGCVNCRVWLAFHNLKVNLSD